MEEKEWEKDFNWEFTWHNEGKELIMLTDSQKEKESLVINLKLFISEQIRKAVSEYDREVFRNNNLYGDKYSVHELVREQALKKLEE